MFTTTQDYYKAFQDIYAALPKSPDDLKEMAAKVQRVIEIEQTNAKDVISTYNKASTGDASFNEINEANKKAKNLFVATRFASIMAFPGAVFALPVLSKIADEYDFNFIPESVKKEFNI